MWDVELPPPPDAVVSGSARMQCGGSAEFDLAPLEVADLDGPQAVPIDDPNHGGKPVAVTAVFGRLD